MKQFNKNKLIDLISNYKSCKFIGILKLIFIVFIFLILLIYYMYYFLKIFI